MEKVETIIANPNLDKGSGVSQASKVFGYIIAAGISTGLGIWANSVIQAKNAASTKPLNPQIINGLQIGGGVGIAMIKNSYAQAIGVGQGVAGVVGIFQKGVGFISQKINPTQELVKSSGDGW